MSNGITIIPSQLRYKSAPSIDQQLQFSVDAKENELNEYDRVASVNLAQLFDDERQATYLFRPTFKVSPIYLNAYTGTTDYHPFRDNLYLVDAERSLRSKEWKGYPQYYEFEFFRPRVRDLHLDYESRSAYTYNWTYYLSIPYENDFSQKMFWTDGVNEIRWNAGDGIPFIITNVTIGGTNYISCKCIAEHNLNIGDNIELSLNYNGRRLFQVNALGNGTLGSDLYIFNILNIGFTGSTFSNNVTGTFKKIFDIQNSAETKSTYYVRKHKIMTNLEDMVVTKSGFEEVPFSSNKKYEFSSLTPNKVARISQKYATGVYNFTLKKDFDATSLLDNQKRPITQIFLTIINKGYSGYFNKPTQGSGLKQGWEFNVTERNNAYWDSNNLNSNTSIGFGSYTKTSGSTEEFYYNLNLSSGNTIAGDWCEWNNITQSERVISNYYHKIKYNQEIFKSESIPTTNPKGFYYQPHIPMTIRVFSNYVETGLIQNVDQVPFWAYFSEKYQSFFWRDIYTYGFKDEENRGVDYPFLNFAHYPFVNSQFRVIPDGGYINEFGQVGDGPLFGPLKGFSIKTDDVVDQPVVDECE